MGYAEAMSDSLPKPDSARITRALQRISDGQSGAADDLMPLVYDELRLIAHHRVERLAPGQTIQATALVHEAWLRLGGDELSAFGSRAHFFGTASLAMRNILVERVRQRNSEEGGGGRRREVLRTGIAEVEGDEPLDLVALDAALVTLAGEYPRPAEVVNLRYFGGLSMEAIAELHEVSVRTVERDWLFARSWLRRVLGDEAGK